jgi:hypothetical protein
MALTLNVNSYVTVSEAEDYFDTRIDASSWNSADADDKESALVTATLILDENQFIGAAVSSTQSLAWPRTSASYLDTKLGQRVNIGIGEIPKRMKLAVFEMANHLLANENLLDNTAQTFEKIKIGSIAIEDNSSDYMPPPLVPNTARKFLKPLLVASASGNSWWRSN